MEHKNVYHSARPEECTRRFNDVRNPDYHPFHVARSEMLRAIGEDGAAQEALDRAIAMATNEAERAYLETRAG